MSKQFFKTVKCSLNYTATTYRENLRLNEQEITSISKFLAQDNDFPAF